MSNAILYAFCLVMLVCAVARAIGLARAIGVPSAPVACSTAAALLYLSWLVPGVAGLLRPWSVTLVLAILSFATIWLFGRLGSPVPSVRMQDALRGAFQGTWTDASLLLAFAGLIGLSPLLMLIARIPRAIFDPQRALPMDVVSCHLPALVEFVQTKSLWTMKGPFSSYGFAYELVGGLPALFFRNHAGLPLAHLVSVVFLLSAMTVLASQHMRASPAAGSRVAMYILSWGAWAALFRDELQELGKNDIFQAACLLTALGFAVEALAVERNAERPGRRFILLLFSATCLGLAIATKATALAYVPLFVAAWAIALLRRDSSTPSSRMRTTLRLGACLAVLGLFGGFFLLRNLMTYGDISDPALGFAWDLSLVANLRNPALYAPRPGALVFLASLLGLPVLAYIWLGGRRTRERDIFYGMSVAFWIVGLCAFSITPHGVFRAGRTYAVWRLRLGMPLFAFACVIGARGAGHLAERLRGSGALLSRILLPVGFLAAALAAPAFWRLSPMDGLPGYERIYELPQTDIYRWVQAIQEPQRIYAAGLRPYGLYGRRWQHTLFYDLYSTVLEPERGGRERLAAVIAQFRPDLILISVDPNSFTPRFDKPLVDWMREQDCFEEVFNDSTASAFRVVRDCHALIERYARNAPPLRMMGEIYSPGPWSPPRSD